MSLSTQCSNTVIGTCDVTSVASTGTITSATFTFTGAGANVPSGDVFTVSLLINQAASGGTCTISAGVATCTISGSFAVTAGQKIMLAVQRTTGTTDHSKTATTAAVESTPGTAASQISGPHTVIGTSAATSGGSHTVTVTLASGAAFSSATSYICAGAGASAVGSVTQFTYNSGSSFTILTSANATVGYICIGN